MREINSIETSTQFSIDDNNQVRQINHLESPWQSNQESPLLAAIDYLQKASTGLSEEDAEGYSESGTRLDTSTNPVAGLQTLRYQGSSFSNDAEGGVEANEGSIRLDWSSVEMSNLQQKLSFTEPRQQGVEYRLGQQKQLFDSTTIIFNQTYLNVPVWRAGITFTIKQNPQRVQRVLMVTNTSERGMNAPLPSEDKIEKHRAIFALAASDQRLRTLGLENQLRLVGVINESGLSGTAEFIRQALGRPIAGDYISEDSGETSGITSDDARAIRGRFFVYRYDEKRRQPMQPDQLTGQATTDSETEAPINTPVAGTLAHRVLKDAELGVGNRKHDTPSLSLPPVHATILDGQWRLVSEVTFSLTTPEYGSLNWLALVDVETDSVLLLEPLVACLDGMVFVRDPITSTGNAANGPDQANNVLNPLRTSVTLPNLDAPVGNVQSLRGRFAFVTEIEAPVVAPPTKPANTAFNFNVRTSDFAAVNAYYHTDRFFALVEGMGFPIGTYFNNTTFPIRVDHRSFNNEINAHCVGNGVNGIEHACYGLNHDDPANPIGRACDSRVHLHELGGHGILYEHVGRPNFGFAHSAGDSLSAILHDPDSRLRDNPAERFRYAPWNPVNTRRFDRAVSQGWGWGGVNDIPFTANDRAGYTAEQILSTTLFRIYQSIGGDSADIGQRQFASRMTMYLILRAISTLTPATNPSNALGFANALMAVDKLNWTTEGLFGGAYSKVIRWAFEKQGLYQPAGAPTPVTTAGAPPLVDVYIDDGRGGEYPYRATYDNNSSIWNRWASDGGLMHQEPKAGVINYVYVKVKNRGTTTAQNVRVRGFHRKAGGGTVWPDDFQPLGTTELQIGTIAGGNAQERIAGPFAWTPDADAAGPEALLMIVVADGDDSNVSQFAAGETISEWRLVPHDNNIGLRKVVPVDAESEAENAARAAEEASLAAQAAAHAANRAILASARARATAADALAAVHAADWNMNRHEAIAAAAMELLPDGNSGNARTNINRILVESGSGDPSLGNAARWADELRSSNRPDDPPSQRFLADVRNRGYSSWHYVNLPLDADGYDRQRYPQFTRDNDIVQMLLHCVAVLQQPDTNTRFEEVIALRWLAHLVGDLHQPVHVGCCYIANAGTQDAFLVRDPDQAVNLPSDRGGGVLRLPTRDNLHSYWDAKLGSISVSLPPAAAVITDPARDFISWANASLSAARIAYQSLEISEYVPNRNPSKSYYKVTWDDEADYNQRCEPIVKRRMTEAAANLAGLLNYIWP